MTGVKRPYRVLALDGGGMRGLYSATVLESLARHFAARRGVESLDLGKGFDLIVGTSTGGILACGLAHGLSPTEIVDLFRKVGPQLFQRPIPDTRLGLLRWALGTLHRSANSDEHLRTALEAVFGNTTLEELFRRRGIALCIPVVNITTGRSLVFKTPHLERFVRDRRFRLVDVCMSTSAAPIYLPLASINDPDDANHQLIFADGGLWANNPVLVGLIEALSVADPAQPIQILSVSTCPLAQGAIASSVTRSWGLLKWKAGTTALTMALESQSWGYHYMASRLAEALRQHGRQCYVLRVPHSSPAPNQAALVALDRASPDSLRVLAELGRQDGDIEAATTAWASGESSAILADMFLSMPSGGRNSETPTERRAASRVPRDVLVGPGTVLRDESPAGACVTFYGPTPTIGARCEFETDDGFIVGTVRWVRELHKDLSVVGVEKDTATAPTAT